MPGQIYIRQMRDGDLPAILDMAFEENWVSDPAEFQMFIDLNPLSCFVCVDNGEVIGSIMVFCHTKSAWIGNFIVSRKYRGKSVGKKLFSRAIEYLDRKRIKHVYLNAAYQAKSLYEKFGFSDVLAISRWEGRPIKHDSNMVNSKKIIPDVLKFLALDSCLWKDDRFSLISQLSSMRYSQSRSEPSGFLMYGNMEDVITVGPWELEGGNERIAEELFISGLSGIESGKRILLDVPVTNKKAEKILSKYGFRIISFTTFMRRGKLPKIRFNEIFSLATMGSMG